MERKVGLFAGFDLLVASQFTGEVVVVLKGACTHTARVQATALGTIRAVEHVVNNFEDALAQTTESLIQARRRILEVDAQLEKPFEYGAKLAALRERQQELVLALDLTKAQASSAMASETIEVIAAEEAAVLADGDYGDWSW